MEFQTNKGTGTRSSNGKYNYAAKLPLKYAIDRFSTLRGPVLILKDLWFGLLSTRGNNEICFRN